MSLATAAIPVEGAGFSRLTNLSIRGDVATGEDTLIAGLTVSGPGTSTVLVRGIGPGLAPFGVAGFLPNPRLALFDARGVQLATNDDWNFAGRDAPATTFATVGAFPLAPGSLDAAVVAALNPGTYTAQLTGAPGTRGIGLIEVYELDRGPSQFVNLSSRLLVGPGSSAGIVGIVVIGQRPKTLLIRGIGPTLAQFGIQYPLGDPTLQVFGHANTVVAVNDNWNRASNAGEIEIAASVVGAFSLPADSLDAAVLVTLVPGAYTAIVDGPSGAHGVALLEVYEVPAISAP